MPNGVPGSWALALNEEFTANGLNKALWTPEWPAGAMSGECTSPSLVSQPGNGYLYLQVRAQESTCSGIKNADTGSLIESNPADGQPGHSGFQYSYGYVEWRAWIPGVAPKGLACPKGGCLPDWPGLWSLSNTNSNEIDTMEGLNALGEECYHIHPPPGSEGPGGCLSGEYAGAWHTFGSEWEPGVVKVFYDGAQVGEVKQAGINGTPQYLLMDMVPPGVKQPLVVPDEMTVDYVRVWQHPAPPPTVSTGSATSVQPAQATLNGTMNPNGVDTHYYFQYGTTTSYGSATSPVDAGSGTSSVPASVTVTGLNPDVTYHYRLVASRSGETPIYGGDQTLATLMAPLPVVVHEAGHNEYAVFYQGSNGALWQESFNGSTWSNYDIGASMAPGASPVVIHEAGHNEYAVFYEGSNGALWQESFNGSTWSNYDIGASMAPGASPVVIHEAGHNEYAVFYEGSNGALWQESFNGSTWSNYDIGASMAPGASPVVIHEAGHNEYAVFYEGSNGALWQESFNGSTWSNYDIGASMAPGASPVVIHEAGHNEYAVFYEGSNGALWQESFNGSTWSNYDIGASMAPGASPVVIHEAGHNEYAVFYEGSNGALWQESFNGSTWSNYDIGASMAPGASPVVIHEAGHNEYAVFYEGSNGALWQESFNGSTWSNYDIGASMAP